VLTGSDDGDGGAQGYDFQKLIFKGFGIGCQAKSN
jgi:hypothetical protein